MAWLVPDFETASSCDLKVCGSARYAEDPTTEILTLHAESMDGERCIWHPGEPMPEMFRRAFAEGWFFVAHGCNFEREIWLHHMVKLFGWPDVPETKWMDTQAKCAMLVLPLGLERALPALHMGLEKDMAGNKLTLSLSKPDKKTGMLPVRTPEIMARVDTYCGSDITNQVALLRRIGWLPPDELASWRINQRINRRGIKVDLDFVDAAQAVVDKATAPLAGEFKQITGFDFGQTKKVTAWVREQGVPIPNLQKETLVSMLGDLDGDTDDDLIKDDLASIVLPEHVERALKIRQLVGSSSVSKLGRLKRWVNDDHRARWLLQWHGTGPGRSAGRGPQPTNFPRGTDENIKLPVEDKVAAIMTRDPAWIETLYGPAVEFVVSSLRHSFVAEDGHEMISGDYSGIQARLVLALAGEHEKTRLMASGADVYCDMASQIFKREVTKKDVKDRQVGKNSVLGLGFQMGWPKFRLKYAQDRTPEFCQEVVRVYRKEWAPGVPKVWYGLQEAATRAVVDRRSQEAFGVVYALEDEWLTATAPSGSKVWYYNPQKVKREMPWSTEDEPDWRVGFTYQAMKNGVLRTIDAFGGQLTENIIMRMEQDLLTEAMKKCEREGFPVILEVYDEVLTEPKKGFGLDQKVLAQILEDVQPWARELKVPIQVDCWTGPRYKK